MGRLDMKVIYMLILTLLLSNFTLLYSQNYYETLGEYNFELVCKADKSDKYFTTYDCDLMIYDKNKQLVNAKYFFLQGNSYEMKKFVINQHTGEEAIFILETNRGANAIWGNLKCVTIKKINTSSSYIEIPISITYSEQMNLEMVSEDENPKLADIVKDIDGDGIAEIVDKKAILIAPAGKITASWVTIISQLKEDKFVLVNDMFAYYISNEIETLVDEAKKTRIKCNEADDFTKYANENLLGGIVISYALINQLDEGLKIFHSLYKCSDADLLEKKILIYYYENVLNNKLRGGY